MSILDRDRKNAFGERNLKTIFTYVGVTLFCMLFHYVYSLFSHGVHSQAMTTMFCYPLVGGVLVFGIFLLLRIPILSRAAYNLYNTGIAVLTVSAMLNGILEIAGTSVSYQPVYWFIGIGFVSLGIVVELWTCSMD